MKKFCRQGSQPFSGCFSDWNSDCKKSDQQTASEFRSKFQSLCFAQLMSSLKNTTTNSNLLNFLYLYYIPTHYHYSKLTYCTTHSFLFDLVENIDHGLILLALNFDLSLTRIEKLLSFCYKNY